MLGASVMGRGWTISGAKWRGGWLVLGGTMGRGMDWACGGCGAKQ